MRFASDNVYCRGTSPPTVAVAINTPPPGIISTPSMRAHRARWLHGWASPSSEVTENNAAGKTIRLVGEAHGLAYFSPVATMRAPGLRCRMTLATAAGVRRISCVN
jgi:hypothetical protein